jgi:hypothetical protein
MKYIQKFKKTCILNSVIDYTNQVLQCNGLHYAMA